MTSPTSPRWASATDVHRLFYDALLTAEGYDDIIDVEPAIVDAETYLTSRLKIAKSTLDAFTSRAITPAELVLVTAKRAAVTLIDHARGGSSAAETSSRERWAAEVDATIADINAGLVVLYDPVTSLAVSVDGVDYAVGQTIEDREKRGITWDLIKDL